MEIHRLAVVGAVARVLNGDWFIVVPVVSEEALSFRFTGGTDGSSVAEAVIALMIGATTGFSVFLNGVSTKVTTGAASAPSNVSSTSFGGGIVCKDVVELAEDPGDGRIFKWNFLCEILV